MSASYSKSSVFDDSNNVSVTMTTYASDQMTQLQLQPSDNRQGIFLACVIAIGAIGLVANAFVLYVLRVSSQLKKQVINVLFVNQSMLDLFSCVWLIVTYSLKIVNIDVTGAGGYWLCTLVVNENLIYIGVVGSTVNLASIAVERYVMIVHPIWHKTKVKSWMIYAMIGVSWICSVLSMEATSFGTSEVIEGVCYVMVRWPSQSVKTAYGLWYFELFRHYFGHICLLLRAHIDRHTSEISRLSLQSCQQSTCFIHQK
jgi:7 transmembrane receptor (rhodopsin family)